MQKGELEGSWEPSVWAQCSAGERARPPSKVGVKVGCTQVQEKGNVMTLGGSFWGPRNTEGSLWGEAALITEGCQEL